MSRPARAALLLGLLLTAPLLTTVEAGVPERPAWAPWTAPQTVTAVALADEGRTIAAALGAYNPQNDQCQPVTQTGCTPVSTDPQQRYDLALLTVQNGFVAANTDNFNDAAPEGRTHAAVSLDGNTVASVGLDRRLDSVSSVPRLYYARAGRDGDWSVAGTNLTQYLEGRPAGLALSEDGRRVVVALEVAGNMSIRGYTFQNGILAQSFNYVLAGRPHDLAASGDLSRIAVVGLATGQFNRSVVLTIPFASGAADPAYFAPEGANLTRVAITRDGSRIAAGGTNGTALLFRAPVGMQQPEPIDAGTGVVARMLFSGDGRRLAIAANTTLRTFDVTGPSTTLRWGTTLGATPRGMDYSRDAQVLVTGSSEGVLAFGEAPAADGTPVRLWTLNGDTSSVSINADASVIAYSQRRLVFAATLARGLVFNVAGGGDVAPSKVVAPNGETSYDLSVYNPGAVPERVTFEGPDDLDVSVRVEPAELVVNPGETASVTAFVRPGQLQAGSRSFNLTARTVSGLSDDVTLSFSIAPVADVSLFLNVTEVLARQNEPSELLIEVRNEGTKTVALGVRAVQSVSPSGPDWNVTVDPSSFTLNANSKTTVRLSVTPPRNAANGTSNAVTVYLEGAEVADLVTVTYRINPEIGIELIPSARVKYIDAGKSDTYNITVRNTGSLPRRFEVFYDLNETSGRSWGIEMPSEPFRLDPLASRVVTIKVTVPVDAAPPDYLKFTVTAQLIPEGEEPVVADHVQIFANAQTPKDEDEEEERDSLIPAPSAAVLAALLGVAALALRRRQRA